MNKVVLLAPTPPPAGGIAGWTKRMLEAELKNGWQVEIVDEKAIGNREVFGKAGRRNYFKEIIRSLRIWIGLRKELKDKNTRVVHSCIPSVTLAMLRECVCAIITKIYGKKFIIHFRCTVPNTTQGKVGIYVLKKLCNISDLIISLNHQTSDYLDTITKTPIRLIPNFISSNELEYEHSIRDELKTVLYVGGLVESKGVYDCIEIAERLPDISFRFVGTGDDEFERKAKERHLSNVVFAGQKSHEGVKEELKNADAFLFMSYFRGEGFSNALCEAMAAGLPCVVSNWAANKDMISNDGGFVVDVNDVDAAVEALNILRNRDVRKAMSVANIRKVGKEYVDTIILGQYVDAYDSLL